LLLLVEAQPPALNSATAKSHAASHEAAGRWQRDGGRLAAGDMRKQTEEGAYGG
jgi:hypothetical protein